MLHKRSEAKWPYYQRKNYIYFYVEWQTPTTWTGAHTISVYKINKKTER